MAKIGIHLVDGDSPAFHAVSLKTGYQASRDGPLRQLPDLSMQP
jgi:hypothetical protein